jgi:hypothetical protein
LNSKLSRFLHHPLSPFRRRTIIAIAILVIVMIVGIEGLVWLESWSFVDAFYFMSLIATSQGPTRSPSTDGGKIFASAMAFVSVGAAISSIAFIFGPLFGTVFKEGMDYLEKEERKVKERVSPKQDRPMTPQAKE